MKTLKKFLEQIENLEEKNVPTSPEKWAQAKAAAKSKFDVYPSAYANGWASKKYKSMGGGWRSTKEEVEELDEISKKTLTSYLKKAQDHRYDLAQDAGWRGPKDKVAIKASQKSMKRGVGIDKANMRMAKEETQVDENHIAIAMGKMLDDESGMVLTQIEELERGCDMIRSYIGKDYEKQLPAWVQAKITLATDYMSTVGNYLVSKNEKVNEEVELSDDELFDILEEYDIDFELLTDEELMEVAAWQRKAGKNPKGGLNRKGIASYRAEHPGSHLSMAVTTPPSKLKPGSKAANRRKSFCARMGGMPGPMKKPNGEPTRKALSLRKWNC